MMQSMQQWERSEKLNLHLEACLLAFSQTHPTGCLHKKLCLPVSMLHSSQLPLVGPGLSHSCGLGLVSASYNLLQIFQLPQVGDPVVIVVHLVQVHHDLHFAPSTRQGYHRQRKYSTQSVHNQWCIFLYWFISMRVPL